MDVENATSLTEQFKQILVFFDMWFVIACLVNVAVIKTCTKIILTIRADLLKNKWFKGFVLTPANLFLGLLAGFIPNFLYGDTLGKRLLVGLCAGFLSNFIYHMFKDAARTLLDGMAKRVKGNKDQQGQLDPSAPPVSPLPSGPTQDNK